MREKGKRLRAEGAQRARVRALGFEGGKDVAVRILDLVRPPDPFEVAQELHVSHRSRPRRRRKNNRRGSLSPGPVLADEGHFADGAQIPRLGICSELASDDVRLCGFEWSQKSGARTAQLLPCCRVLSSASRAFEFANAQPETPADSLCPRSSRSAASSEK